MSLCRMFHLMLFSQQLLQWFLLFKSKRLQQTWFGEYWTLPDVEQDVGSYVCFLSFFTVSSF